MVCSHSVFLDTPRARTYGPPAFEPRRPVLQRFFGVLRRLMSPDPDRLRDLEKRLDQLQAKQAPKRPPPSQAGIAGRFATELVAISAFRPDRSS
jgi:hypothetical protein